jgi:hypothetical protein
MGDVRPFRYRLRFGELLDCTEADWEEVDPGFFAYAVGDALATHRVYPALADIAYRLMCNQGFTPQAVRYDIRPDALEKFGYFSEVVQVKASIVLAHMFRQGVRVDQAKVRELTRKCRQDMDGIIGALRRDFHEVLSFQRDGSLRLTPKSQTPSLTDGKLVPFLHRVVEEIRSQGQDITVPRSGGKKKGISKSVKEWKKYARFHPFFRLWEEMKRLEKLLGFLAGLDVPVLHCQYALLTRTGRTACARSRSSNLPGVNLQQMPKAAEFRELFVPPAADQRLFIGDYSAIELCTFPPIRPPHIRRSGPNDIGLRVYWPSRPPLRRLVCDSCSSGQEFACRFLRTPPRDGRPCVSARSSCH